MSEITVTVTLTYGFFSREDHRLVVRVEHPEGPDVCADSSFRTRFYESDLDVAFAEMKSQIINLVKDEAESGRITR